MRLSELIELVHRHAHRRWNAMGQEVGLSHSEFEYLSAIKEQEHRQVDANNHGQHLQDVVEDMGVRKASASVMVVKLEELGWVRRVPCQFDARAQHILLTEEGEARLQLGKSVYAAAVQTLLPALDERTRSALGELFDPT